jgi:D-alanine-D-alanine ligase
LRELSHLKIECWRLFGLTGYARVDFRCDSQQRPWILEINTNPCISPDAGFAAALAHAGLSYEAGLQLILEDALERNQRRASSGSCTEQAAIHV